MQKDVSTVGATLSEVSSVTSSASLQLVILEHGCLARCPLPRGGSVRIGRSEASEIVLSDPAASRLHAILHLGAALELEDAGSHNGTRVRNQRIGSGQRSRVSLGDAIQIGNAVLIVQNAPAAGRTTKQAGMQSMGQSERELIVRDEAMLEVYDRVQRIAASHINVLIVGETGVGKELVSEAVHRASGRRQRARASAAQPGPRVQDRVGAEVGADPGVRGALLRAAAVPSGAPLRRPGRRRGRGRRRGHAAGGVPV